MKAAKKTLPSSVLNILLLILAVTLAGCGNTSGQPETTAPPATTEPTVPPTTVVTEPPHNWVTGYIGGLRLDVNYCGEDGAVLGSLLRGTQVEYEQAEDGAIAVLLADEIVYLSDGAAVVSDPAEIIPAHTLYVRTAVNLRDQAGRLLVPLAEKGAAVEVIGYDYLLEDGRVHMYRVTIGEDEGYIMPWYLTNTEDKALANYDNGSYHIHASRKNVFGGGSADNLDYFPRDKSPIQGNEMPEECRTLYLASDCLSRVEEYLEIADNSGINAFVVAVTEGYAGDVVKQYSPTTALNCVNTLDDYQAAIQKIKDAGYYVIGRITTFHDNNFVKDHPELAISTFSGEPMKLAGGYWPTAYSREVWQYKVDLAVEAVELMGFNEIQFDYVRFPDNTMRYEKDNTIYYHNTYGETKAQAIQRFLMYAADILRDHGAYVSADVFGECAYTYVTAYGQYWPAISNVVDAISGMPYPDHFSPRKDWLPWEHPYDILYEWGQYAMDRQGETPTPGAVRTWIQAYNAIREPYNTYGVKEISAQIRALRDAGCTGGYMTWNSLSDIEKYRRLIPAFDPPAGE